MAWCKDSVRSCCSESSGAICSRSRDAPGWAARKDCSTALVMGYVITRRAKRRPGYVIETALQTDFSGDCRGHALSHARVSA